MIIARQVRHQLEHGTVWQDRDSVDNYDGLVRALRDGGPERPQLVAGVIDCLTDENVLVRSGAVAALPEVSQETGAERLRALLMEHLDLFRDVHPAMRMSIADLEEGMAQSIARAAGPRDAKVIAYLREAVRRPWGSSLLFRLAAIDSEWLIENAAELVPKDYFATLIPLTPEQRRRMIAAVGGFQGAPSEFYWKQFPEHEAAELKQLLNVR